MLRKKKTYPEKRILSQGTMMSNFTFPFNSQKSCKAFCHCPALSSDRFVGGGGVVVEGVGPFWTPMTSIFEGQPTKKKAFSPSKTRVIWVLGAYIYICSIYLSICLFIYLLICLHLFIYLFIYLFWNLGN